MRAQGAFVFSIWCYRPRAAASGDAVTLIYRTSLLLAVAGSGPSFSRIALVWSE